MCARGRARNRHCPKCQALSQARWIGARSERLLPVSYFHVVFTLPSELRTIARLNRRLAFDAISPPPAPRSSRSGSIRRGSARFSASRASFTRGRAICASILTSTASSRAADHLPHKTRQDRHYGLLAPANVGSLLEDARSALGAHSEPCVRDMRALLLVLTGIDVAVCPACGALELTRQPLPAARSPPSLAA